MARRYSPRPLGSRLTWLVRSLVTALRRPGQWPGAWAVVWFGFGSVGSAIDKSFQHHHVTAARAVTAAFLVGVLAGCAWQWLNRRDLVGRFVPLIMIAIGVGVLALLSVDAVDIDEPAAAMLSGLVAGNVLLEWWLRLPAQRDRFEDSLPRPMTGGTRVP